MTHQDSSKQKDRVQQEKQQLSFGGLYGQATIDPPPPKKKGQDKEQNNQESPDNSNS